MDKATKVSNIQTGHSLEEYERYFGRLYDKGKIYSFKESEKKFMDPNRQHWKIKNENGEIRYYELPKYVKADDTRTAYSFNRVIHRRPARGALLILASTAVLSIGFFFIGRQVSKGQNVYPDVPLTELGEYVRKYNEWKETHPTEDITTDPTFTLSDLANIAMGNSVFKNPEERRPTLTVGRGNTVTTALGFIEVHVDVTNSFIYKDGKALEESISFSENPLAPKVGNRDYLENDEVKRYQHEASSPTEVHWDGQLVSTRSKDEYIALAGKKPDEPYLYVINNDSVLTDTVYDYIDGNIHYGKSKANKVDGGYEIYLDLHNKIAPANYVKRMKYLSGKDINPFYTIALTLKTDNDMRLISTHVDEKYYVEFGGSTEGHLNTYFYYDDDVVDIPSPTVEFDYSKYPQK